MEDRIHLCVMTIDTIKYEKMVYYVGLPLGDGEVGVMANHTPLLAAIKDGPIKCKYADTVEYLYAGDGVVNVQNNEVIMLVRAAEKALDIDISRAKASKQRASERIRNKDKSTDINRAVESLRRALAREKVYHLSKESGM